MSQEESIEELFVKANGEIKILNHKIGNYLGKGGFATCYEITTTQTQQKYAAKIIPKTILSKPQIRKKLMSEIKIHRTLKHPAIVGFERFFEDNKNVYILLELCSNQSLKELLRRRTRLTEIEVKNYTLQMLAGVEYMHSIKIVHRDLKLGNIFINNAMELKLGDMGLSSRVQNNELNKTICGTPNYIAPEMLEIKGHSFGVDIWAIGVIMYTLLVGLPPFQSQDLPTTYQRIRKASFKFPNNLDISEHAKELVSSILVKDPVKRPSICSIREHPFFTASQDRIPRLLPNFTLFRDPPPRYLHDFATNRLALEEAEEVWVCKWLDHSSKHGFGYLLSNGCTGTDFNDGSKMLMSGETVFYSKIKNGKDVLLKYDFNEYPKKLYKKIILLQNFNSYLDTNSNNCTTIENDSQLVYIKKWIRTKDAILFRMSSKTVQVSFNDNTELLLSSETNRVIFTNKQGEKKYHTLNSDMKIKDPQLKKRLKYTREVLSKFTKDKNK